MARASWTGALTCGLVSVPVKLAPARSDRSIKFHQMSPAGNRVRQKRVDEKTGAEVAYEDIVKGFQISPDQYVILSEEELAQIEPGKTKELALDQFAKFEDVPTMAYKNAYYAWPADGGAKSYRLLAETLSTLGVVGVGRMVMRTVEYPATVRALEDGLLLVSTLCFDDEINKPENLVPEVEISTAERKMAMQLVEAMTSPLDYTAMHDEHREKVLRLIEAKAAGIEPVVEQAEEPAPSADLMSALEASLQTIREEAAPKKKRAAKTKTR